MSGNVVPSFAALALLFFIFNYPGTLFLPCIIVFDDRLVCSANLCFLVVLSLSVTFLVNHVQLADESFSVAIELCRLHQPAAPCILNVLFLCFINLNYVFKLKIVAPN